jgi:hypothetical protein
MPLPNLPAIEFDAGSAARLRLARSRDWGRQPELVIAADGT